MSPKYFLALGLASGLILTAESAQKNESQVATAQTDTAQKASSPSTKQEIRKKRKEERARKLLASSEETLKELETKAASTSDLIKKKATLALSHAKLELDAAKDEDFSETLSFHARRAKQYLFRAKEIIEGKDIKKQTEKAPEKA